MSAPSYSSAHQFKFFPVLDFVDFVGPAVIIQALVVPFLNEPLWSLEQADQVSQWSQHQLVDAILLQMTVQSVLDLRPWQNEDTLWWQHCWRNRVSQMLTRFATCVTFVSNINFVSLDTKCFWKSSETFVVSARCAAMLLRFGMGE